MRHLWITFLLIMVLAMSASAQQGVSVTTDNTPPDASAIFDVKSTTRGVLVPRMTLVQRNAIATPATGLLIYQTNGTTGFYYYNGTAWTAISAAADNLGNHTATTNLNLGTNSITNTTNITASGTANLGGNAYPTVMGTSGQVLTTNGAGLTSWGSVAGESTTANNGLTVSGVNVALGGDLIGTTNINQDNAEVLRINNNSTVGTVIDLQNTGDFRILDAGVNALQLLDNGTLTVGTTNQFQVNNAGNITRINNLVTSFPTVQGTAGQVLTNDGAGDLSWTTIADEATTANNGLTLAGQNVTLGGDLTATTTITQDNAEVLRINNNGTAGTIIDLQNTGDLRVMDNGTNAFQVLDDGRVIIGTASQLSINNTGNITRLNNVVTNFPNAQGAAGTFLNNDGAGNLDWVAAPSFTDPTTASNGLTLIGNDVRLGGTLAANTTITQNAAQSLTFSNISTANTAINMQSTGDFVVQDNGVSALTVQDNGNVSIGTTNQMQIDNTGDFVRINNVPTNFPAAQGIAGQVLTNNGTGDLTWTNGSGFNWSILGNGNTTAGTHFIGTTNNIPLEFRVGNQIAGFISEVSKSNAFFGHLAGFSITSGDGNTGIGKNALGGNSTGGGNTAVGNGAAISNLLASSNTAIGQSALINNLNSSRNTVVGESAMFTFDFANGGAVYNAHNTAIGRASLFFLNATSNANGIDNTALGVQSGLNATTNIGCTYLGTATYDATPGYLNSTAIGYNCTIDASNRVRVGGSGVTSVGGPVAYTNFSDKRFKHNVCKDVKGLDVIMKLEPVTYQFDYEALDRFYHRPDSMIAKTDYTTANDLRQIGFMAQEIDSLCQAMGFEFGAVDRPSDSNSGIYGIRYTAFVPILVKAVQEQQLQIDVLTLQNQAAIAENAQIKAQYKLELESLKAEVARIHQTLPLLNASNYK